MLALILNSIMLALILNSIIPYLLKKKNKKTKKEGESMNLYFQISYHPLNNNQLKI